MELCAGLFLLTLAGCIVVYVSPRLARLVGCVLLSHADAVEAYRMVRTQAFAKRRAEFGPILTMRSEGEQCAS